MTQGIILRVLEGTALTPELSRILGELLPGYQLEEFRIQPDYHRSIKERVNSLHEAFNFILDAYPPTSSGPFSVKAFRAYAEECKAACNFNKNSLDELHIELEKYLAKLMQVMTIYWEWDASDILKAAVECLNEAEQYVIMDEGRPTLATLTPAGSDEFLLQLDEPLPAYDAQFMQEIEFLKTMNYPKTPDWFRALSEYQQNYFCSLNLAAFDTDRLSKDFNDFIKMWPTIKADALNIQADLTQINNGNPPFPVWFNNLNNISLQTMIVALAAKPEEFDSQLQKIDGDSLGLVLRLPQWYLVLSEIQQCFLAHAKNFDVLSSRHRTLPIPANFGTHELLKLVNGEVRSFLGKRYYSAHIASRDTVKHHYPEAVQQRHVDSNLEKILSYSKSEQLILLQTLISPIYLLDWIPEAISEWLPEFPPDLDLYKLLRAAVARSNRSQYILQNNHPQNVAKRYYYTAKDDPDSLRLIFELEKIAPFAPGLQDLINDYKSALDSPPGTATLFDYDGRELFLSSHEELMIMTAGGFPYSSCVSAKDRRGCGLVHIDAMLDYKDRYGAWPKFIGDPKSYTPQQKEDRKNFVAIFADIYVSRHRHAIAGFNAPGSNGIKTPKNYLPKDICNAINNRVGSDHSLRNDDRLATDNEVDKISTPTFLRNNFMAKDKLRYKLIATELGEEMCTRLYDALSSLISQQSLFIPLPKEGWTPLLKGGFHYVFWKNGSDDKNIENPEGIKEIRKLMSNLDAGTNNIDRMATIFEKVLSRPAEDDSRTESTKSVYRNITNLVNPSDHGDSLEPLALGAIEEWCRLFLDFKNRIATAKKLDQLSQPSTSTSISCY